MGYCDVTHKISFYQESTLSFEVVLSVEVVEFLGILFDAKFLKRIKELLAKQDELRKISKHKLQKVSFD